MERYLQIGVCGGGGERVPPSEKALTYAYETGRLIAERGYLLLTGGLGGVMEQASKGASDADGLVMGVLPGSKKEDANPYCNIIIPTGVGWSRERININTADGIILIGGHIGTDLEGRIAAGSRTPAVAITGTEGVSDRLADTKPYSSGTTIYAAKTPEEALSVLEKLMNVLNK